MKRENGDNEDDEDIFEAKKITLVEMEEYLVDGIKGLIEDEDFNKFMVGELKGYCYDSGS